MAAQTTRRRVSLLSLPIVVGIGLLTVAKLASWQRSDRIKDLTNCIAHGETRTAIDAVRKLAAMTNPPISVLVTAAAADEHDTAEAGQLALSQLLFRWEQEIESKQRVGSVAGQLSELSQSLADKRSEFFDTDNSWLETTARKILRIANKFPPPKTLLVAVDCDAILTAVRVGRLPATMPNTSPVVGKTNPAIKEQTDNMAVSPTVVAGNPAPEKANLEHEFSEFAPPPRANDGPTSEKATEKVGGSVNAWQSPTPPSTTESSLDFDHHMAGSRRDQLPASDLSKKDGRPAGDESSERMSSLQSSSRHSEWPQPVFRILPAMPVNAPPSDGKPSDRVARGMRSTSTSGDPSLRAGVAANESLSGINSRELLRRWLAAEDGDVRAVERELAKRGFGRVTKRMVRQFFSDDADERMRVVDDVLAEPGAGSEPWLLLLADDADADVRLFAVTLMATSNDASLTEKAWQIAIRDHDPRIADLAERLRDRRAGKLRR